jgi:N-acetyl sugar amidotransferase
MRYCKRCVQPDTRPGIFFSEDGICGACLWEDEKKTIDWNAREKELQDLVEQVKSAAEGQYHCVVGVSGGKDSTFQALYARDKLGLRTLLVNGEPDGITEIGRHNIENLKQLGFDVISIRPNPLVLKKLIRCDFFSSLNPVRVSEYPLWASAYLIAIQFNIPLVIQGENPGQTLGTSKHTGAGGDALTILRHNTISNDPMKVYTDENITEDDLFLYKINQEKLLEKNIKAIWLSYYAREWSQPHNAAFSIKHGLRIRPNETNPYDIGTYRFHSQLDCSILEVNQLLKYVKFGFGQATDHACYDIRDGLITREEGIYLVKELDGRCGSNYIKQFCGYIGITEEEFWNHANTFRGDMWRKTNKDEWELIEPIWEQTCCFEKYSIQDIISRLLV